MKTKLFSAILIFLLLFSTTGTLSFAAAKLATPTGVKATALTSSSIRISWNAVKGSSGYEVYYLSDGKSQFLSKTSATSYTDTDSIESVHGYSYQVRAYSLSGGKRTYSSFSSYTTVVTPLDAPDLLSAEDMTSNSIQLSWQVTPEASGYIIYRALSPEGKYTYLATSTKTKYLDQTVNGSTKYYYKVRAYTTYGGKKVYSKDYSLVCSAQTIPNGQKYLNVLFIGNSLTMIPDINGQFSTLCKKAGKYVKVHSVISLGATLADVAPIFQGELYQYDKENADIVIFQEYGGHQNETTADAVKQMMPCFKHAKFYFMPSWVYKFTAEEAYSYRLSNVRGIKNLKTYHLCEFLFNKYDYLLFRVSENDYHPNTLYGYACAALVYSTFFGTDPTTLPDDFVNIDPLPKDMLAKRKVFFTDVRKAVKQSLAAYDPDWP